MIDSHCVTSSYEAEALRENARMGSRPGHHRSHPAPWVQLFNMSSFKMLTACSTCLVAAARRGNALCMTWHAQNDYTCIFL